MGLLTWRPAMTTENIARLPVAPSVHHLDRYSHTKPHLVDPAVPLFTVALQVGAYPPFLVSKLNHVLVGLVVAGSNDVAAYI